MAISPRNNLLTSTLPRSAEFSGSSLSHITINENSSIKIIIKPTIDNLLRTFDGDCATNLARPPR